MQNIYKSEFMDIKQLIGEATDYDKKVALETKKPKSQIHVGTGLYASVSLGRGSYEAVTFALAEKNNWQVKIVRMALVILVVIIGVLLGGKFGICTIITVIISGPIIQFVNAKAKRILKI